SPCSVAGLGSRLRLWLGPPRRSGAALHEIYATGRPVRSIGPGLGLSAGPPRWGGGRLGWRGVPGTALWTTCPLGERACCPSRRALTQVARAAAPIGRTPP